MFSSDEGFLMNAFSDTCRLQIVLADRFKVDQLAVVVAQLIERSLPTPEICGSNPNIGEISSTNCALEKTRIKKNRQGVAHLLMLYRSKT